jgi:hypothetical protein
VSKKKPRTCSILLDHSSITPQALTAIELLFECPLCFWLYVGKNIPRPSTALHTINNAIDQLLKKEFDTHFFIFGAVDDIWVNSQGELIVIDYKASGNTTGELYPSCKRQLEIYQWLLRQNGFTVHPRGYFVYCHVDYAKGFTRGYCKYLAQVRPYELPAVQPRLFS